MVTTAEREAWRLNRAEARHQSLSADVGDESRASRWDIADGRDHAAIRLRLREALQAFADLPQRRRDIKALQVTGFSYDEIARMRGLTYTSVNHLLTEANTALRKEQARSAAADRTSALPRARRLDELERKPPRWLLNAIGRRPSLDGDWARVVAWRRAALTIDDYRRSYGRGLGDDPIGERPAGRARQSMGAALRCAGWLTPRRPLAAHGQMKWLFAHSPGRIERAHEHAR